MQILTFTFMLWLNYQLCNFMGLIIIIKLTSVIEYVVFRSLNIYREITGVCGVYILIQFDQKICLILFPAKFSIELFICMQYSQC